MAQVLTVITTLQKSFLSLVKLGIGNDSSRFQLDHTDWEAIQALAERQGLSAIVLDGINRIRVNGESVKVKDAWLPPKEKMLEWIGVVMQNYEFYYELYRRAIAEIAGFYNNHGFRMMVLKGYACALNWPRPEHRPCGDIDIWLFGKQRMADKVLSKELCVAIDNTHHHHTVFTWQGFTIENHYDFLNVHHHKSNQELEKFLKQLGEDDSHFVDVNGERVYLPSPNLHALFLVRHAAAHFAATEITLRHLLDWGFFVEKHSKDVDWVWLLGVLGRFGMKEIFDIFNAICVKDLGFDSNPFPETSKVDEAVKERVLSEILSPQYSEDMPKLLVKRVVWKIRRWKANEWKHKLCYNESMWSAFWSGVWNHVLKPASI